MNTKLILILLMGCANSVSAADRADYPKFYSGHSPEASAAFAEEAKADFSIFYDHDDKLNIGIGPVRDDFQYPITFTFDELRSFWERQRHKSFILVTLSKANRTEAESNKVIVRINDYFFACGFQRVRIHEAYAFGIGVLSDSTNPSKKSDAVPNRPEAPNKN